jgi:hypothetical protein
LLEALAPRADLLLLLPRLPEAVALTSFQTTGLGNLTSAELEELGSRYENGQSQTGQWPAELHSGVAYPAAPYVGSSIHTEAPADSVSLPQTTAPDELAEGGVGVNEAAALAAPETYAQPSPPESAADETTFQSVAEFNLPALEAAPVREQPAVESPVRNSILDVALAALQALPTDEASINFRVIQYARLATRLAASHDFAVIYASDWQSWLAGMEIRQLTGKPLVLHVNSLAQERNTPADRGWVMEMERMALRRADLVLTATPDLSQSVLEFYELSPPRVHCLNHDTNSNPDLLAETILSALREIA